MEDCGGTCIYPDQQCCPTNTTIGITCPGSYTYTSGTTYTVPGQICSYTTKACSCRDGELGWWLAVSGH